MVPSLWKKSTVIPVPKISCPLENKDYRPITLTCAVMKCFEKFIVNLMKPGLSPFLDPLQYAYRQGRSTEDAIVSVTHLVSKHLEKPKAYARILFADFSSAFDTVCPNLLIQKLFSLQVNPWIVKWFYSLLINRTQQVNVNGTLSEAKSCSTGIPQGAVSSPPLFILYTNECRSSQPNNFIIKFSNDTIILSLLCAGDCPSVYFNEIVSFKDWCERHHLILNTNKTKEMILDPRECESHSCAVIGDCDIEQVDSYKYLGVIMDNAMKWSAHVDFLCTKLSQRLHFLRRLRLFGVSPKVMLTFYNAVFNSLIRYGLVAWFGTLSVQNKSKIEKLIKSAMKVIGHINYSSLHTVFLRESL